MNLSGKKLFLIGFIVILLVGIPLTVYILQQQTNTQQHAAASTNLAFSPNSSASAPIQENIGSTIPLAITVDPGKNLVSFVKLEIQYDPTVLATASANAFVPNVSAFPSVLEGPIYSPGKIAVTLSVGPDPTKAIQQAVTAATINFVALKATPPGTPTLVSYTTNTQVLSIGPNDQASENVLSSATPATIAITGTSPSPTSTVPTGTPAPSVAVSPTPSTAPTAAPSSAPTATPTVQLQPVISGTPSSNPPICSSLTINGPSTGNAPYALTFTASGSSSAETISKVTFNFGDGQISDVTQSGGIGTASVNVQAAHTYSNPGTFTANAILTDSTGAVSSSDASSSANCSQTITVNAASGSGTVNPSPTMPATGSTGIAVGISLSAMFLIVGGGLLFFIL